MYVCYGIKVKVLLRFPENKFYVWKQPVNHTGKSLQRSVYNYLVHLCSCLYDVKVRIINDPRMRVGSVFSHVYLSITFEPLHIETSILVCRYIFTISRSSLSIKVIGSRSYEKNDNFTYFNMLILCMRLHVINKLKVTHQGEGNIKVKISTSFQFFNVIYFVVKSFFTFTWTKVIWLD